MVLLRFKEFHGVHDDLKIIRKRLTLNPVQKKEQLKKNGVDPNRDFLMIWSPYYTDPPTEKDPARWRKSCVQQKRQNHAVNFSAEIWPKFVPLYILRNFYFSPALLRI